MKVLHSNYSDILFKYINNYLTSIYKNEFGLSVTAKDIIIDLPNKIYIKCNYAPPQQLSSYSSYPFIENPRISEVQIVGLESKQQLNKLYGLLTTNFYEALNYIKEI